MVADEVYVNASDWRAFVQAGIDRLPTAIRFAIELGPTVSIDEAGDFAKLATIVAVESARELGLYDEEA